MATRTTLTTEFPEKSTAKFTATITQEDGTTGFLPTTLVLTHFLKEDGSIVNSVNATDILNTGRGTVSAGGALVLLMTPSDMVIVNPRSGKMTETHILLLEWTWSSGTKAGKHEIEFEITDYAKVS